MALQDITSMPALCLKPGPRPGYVHLAMMCVLLLAVLFTISCAALLLQTKLFGVQSRVPHQRHCTLIKSSIYDVPGFREGGSRGK